MSVETTNQTDDYQRGYDDGCRVGIDTMANVEADMARYVLGLPRRQRTNALRRLVEKLEKH